MTAPLVNDASLRERPSSPRPTRLFFWAFKAAEKDWQGRGLTIVTPDRAAHTYGPSSPEPAVIGRRVPTGTVSRSPAGGSRAATQIRAVPSRR